mgnify:FL=1
MLESRASNIFKLQIYIPNQNTSLQQAKGRFAQAHCNLNKTTVLNINNVRACVCKKMGHILDKELQ